MNFSIGSDGDLEVVDGEVLTVNGGEEIRQFLKQRFKTTLATWFLDLSLGVPYNTEILVKKVNPNLIASIFINEIVSTPGINELEEFDLNFDAATRKLLVSFRATTVDDDLIVFNEEVP